MADLRDLYQEVILEHSKAPRNYRELQQSRPQGGGLQSALRRSLHGVSADGGRYHSGYRVSRLGMRHLQSFGVDDDAGLERQDAGRKRTNLFERFHDVVTGHAAATAAMRNLASWRCSRAFRSFRRE